MNCSPLSGGGGGGGVILVEVEVVSFRDGAREDKLVEIDRAWWGHC